MMRLPLHFSLTLVLCACQTPASAPKSGQTAEEQARMHKAGLVLISDLEHASAWEKLIHVDMGVPPRKIDVKEGPGLTTVTIHELKNRADAETIAQGLRQYAEKHPEKYGPTKVVVQLKNEAATISPFELPSDLATRPGSIFNQGGSLPGLSSQPLLPGVR